jgi:hypothetical protein
MTYRPSISEDVDRRVDLHMVGKQGNKNEVYERAIKLMLDGDGDEQELAALMIDGEGEPEQWLKYLRAYADSKDKDPSKVLNAIITQVLDPDGEANVQFKGRLKLDDLE